MANSKELKNNLKEISKMITRVQKVQQEQTTTQSNLSTPFSIEEKTVLVHMITNIVKEELQTNEMVLQKVVSSNLKVTNERLEKLSREVSDMKERLEFTQKQLEDETKAIKKDFKSNETEDLLDLERITNKLTELEDR